VQSDRQMWLNMTHEPVSNDIKRRKSSIDSKHLTTIPIRPLLCPN
jgi:hypothetical protein